MSNMSGQLCASHICFTEYFGWKNYPWQSCPKVGQDSLDRSRRFLSNTELTILSKFHLIWVLVCPDQITEEKWRTVSFKLYFLFPGRIQLYSMPEGWSIGNHGPSLFLVFMENAYFLVLKYLLVTANLCACVSVWNRVLFYWCPILRSLLFTIVINTAYS